MTAKKDLKRRVRERQAETGESYVTARRRVVAQAPAATEATEATAATAATAATVATKATEATEPTEATEATKAETSQVSEAERLSAPVIEVDETLDLTAQGTAHGFACRIYSTSKLASLVDHESVLRRIRTILDTTSEDPEMRHFRAVILRGERPLLPVRHPDWLEATRRFINRGIAGIGGLSEGGNMLVFTHGTTIVLANIGFRRAAPVMSDEPPRLVLSALVEEGYSASMLYVR